MECCYSDPDSAVVEQLTGDQWREIQKYILFAQKVNCLGSATTIKVKEVTTGTQGGSGVNLPFGQQLRLELIILSHLLP